MPLPGLRGPRGVAPGAHVPPNSCPDCSQVHVSGRGRDTGMECDELKEPINPVPPRGESYDCWPRREAEAG